MLSRCNVVNFYYHIMFPYTRQHVISTSHLKILSLLFTPFSVTRFAMHRIYADRINSRGMSRVFCDLRSQKTPRGILPMNSNILSTLTYYLNIHFHEHRCKKEGHSVFALTGQTVVKQQLSMFFLFLRSTVHSVGSHPCFRHRSDPPRLLRCHPPHL